MKEPIIDFKAMMNTIVNAQLLQNEDMKPVFKLLNKYGIHGLEAINFINEFATAVQLCNFTGEKDEKHTTE